MNIYQIFDKKQINNKMIIGLNTELRAIFLYNAFQEQNNSILVVTNSLYEANQLYQSIMNYTNEVLLFPMDDFLTSEALAISPELKAIRLETLIELSKNNKKMNNRNMVAVINRRGVYTPSAGKVEFQMAKKFKENAQILEPHYPKTAKIFNKLYEEYMNESDRERLDAENGWL